MTDVPQPSRSAIPLWTVALAGITGVAYWAFLGWDQHKDTDPVTGSQTGPYQAWQVIGLGVVLALLVFEAGRRGRPWLASPVVSAVLTVSFAVDAATDADGDGLWPIGAALVAIGSLLGTALVAGVGAHLGRRRRAR
jgi:peptidoglycan/LPS O-acetylase OafA/YrhL